MFISPKELKICSNYFFCDLWSIWSWVMCCLLGVLEKKFEIYIPKFSWHSGHGQKLTCFDSKCVLFHWTQVFLTSSPHEVDDVEQTNVLEHSWIRVLHVFFKVDEEFLFITVCDALLVNDLPPAFLFVFFQQSKEQFICSDEFWILGNVNSSVIFEIMIQSSSHCTQCGGFVLLNFLDLRQM